jgi:hypothetical protein
MAYRMGENLPPLLHQVHERRATFSVEENLFHIRISLTHPLGAVAPTPKPQRGAFCVWSWFPMAFISYFMGLLECLY